ncbi:MAG: hypothetical protein A2X59_10865 [Nitrospirae bacterium GWC2_42_7]|nr:MAG: hypothetical protein A2X59_10865 [Nitrospirae bacterium GWC2_42_7]
MENNILKIMNEFIDGNVEVNSFLNTLEEWNRSGGLWKNLSKREYQLLSNYMRFYADMYYGEVLPKFSFWKKIKRQMNGEPDVDLATLKKGTAELIKALNKIREKSSK